MNAQSHEEQCLQVAQKVGPWIQEKYEDDHSRAKIVNNIS